MPFAAAIIVRKSNRDGKAYAGFASQTPTGETLATFVYGSQLSYRSSNVAMTYARNFAADYNNRLPRVVAPITCSDSVRAAGEGCLL